MSTAETEQRRNQVLLGPLPPSFLRLETRTSENGETTTTVTAEPSMMGGGQQQQGQQGQQQQQQFGAQALQPMIQNQQQVRPNYPTQGGYSVTVCQALLNKSYTMLGSMDPYLRLRVGHNVYETHTAASADRNPRWNKVFHCPVPSSVTSFSLEIFDERSIASDERIAWCTVSVPDTVREGHMLDEWFPLSGKQGDGKEGTINLIISYTNMPVSLPYQSRNAYVTPGYYVHPAQQQRVAPPTITEADIDNLKDMFPDVERVVLKTVLEGKHGNMEGAISALLQMTEDMEQASVPNPASLQPASAEST